MKSSDSLRFLYAVAQKHFFIFKPILIHFIQKKSQSIYSWSSWTLIFYYCAFYRTTNLPDSRADPRRKYNRGWSCVLYRNGTRIFRPSLSKYILQG